VIGNSEINSDYLPEPPLGVFTVEIATPSGSSADWRPFPTQELPLAEYARQIVERFDFKAEVIELATDHDPDTSRPGIILIDPRFVTIPGGRSELEAAVSGLPKWILPMLIVDQPDDARTKDLAERVRDILLAAGAPHSRSARRSTHGVSSVRTFSLLVRDLLFEAEKQYITHRTKQRYGTPVVSRPSSRRSGPFRPDRFASGPDRLGETTDDR
jgi:FxsC-like protein